jgi:hypothetical protein
MTPHQIDMPGVMPDQPACPAGLAADASAALLADMKARLIDDFTQGRIQSGARGYAHRARVLRQMSTH